MTSATSTFGWINTVTKFDDHMWLSHKEKDMPDRINYRINDPLTPAQAIRAKCLECVGYEPGEVRDCTAVPGEDCFLPPYRMGRGCDRSQGPDPMPTRQCRLLHVRG